LIKLEEIIKAKEAGREGIEQEYSGRRLDLGEQGGGAFQPVRAEHTAFF
jgi:hypothetical protein